jgi:hypothetical protein
LLALGLLVGALGVAGFGGRTMMVTTVAVSFFGVAIALGRAPTRALLVTATPVLLVLAFIFLMWVGSR